MTETATRSRRLSPYRLAVARRVVFARDGYRCVRCGWAPPSVPEDYNGWYALAEYDDRRCVVRCLHLDHIRPLVLGGTNDLDNLQTLCDKCNCSKGGRVA